MSRDNRGRAALPAPTDLSNVEWTETSRSWHAITAESRARWCRTLCGSTADGLYAVPAVGAPDGPSWPGIFPATICPKCLDRVARLAPRAPA